MPDHEEAVREAEWTYNEQRDFLVDVVPSVFVDEFESVVRASERAKYSALVSALKRVRANFEYAVAGVPVRDMAETLAECDAALTALQSKEGTNE